MTDERKPLWPWMVALLIGLPGLYVASFGPACWAMGLVDSGSAVVSTVFRPMMVLIIHGPAPISDALSRYANVFSQDSLTVEPVDLEWVHVRHFRNLDWQ